jgi:hypothetical protein
VGTCCSFSWLTLHLALERIQEACLGFSCAVLKPEHWAQYALSVAEQLSVLQGLLSLYIALCILSTVSGEPVCVPILTMALILFPVHTPPSVLLFSRPPIGNPCHAVSRLAWYSKMCYVLINIRDFINTLDSNTQHQECYGSVCLENITFKLHSVEGYVNRGQIDIYIS